MTTAIIMLTMLAPFLLLTTAGKARTRRARPYDSTWRPKQETPRRRQGIVVECTHVATHRLEFITPRSREGAIEAVKMHAWLKGRGWEYRISHDTDETFETIYLNNE